MSDATDEAGAVELREEYDLAVALGVPPTFLHRYVRKGTGTIAVRADGRPELFVAFRGPRKNRDGLIPERLFDQFLEQWGETVRRDFLNSLTETQRANRLRQDEHTRAMHALLPEAVCVLDIETTGFSTKTSRTTCVGVKEYHRTEWPPLAPLVKTHYEPVSYECFGTPPPTAEDARSRAQFVPGGMAALEHRLQTFSGPIVGHNILEFDLRFLDSLIDLHGIVEKTVDTLYVLWDHAGRDLFGLSLDSLAPNGKGKILLDPVIDRKRGLHSGTTIPQMWKQGRYAEVIAYNERDCDLTHDLWWHLILHRTQFINRETIWESLRLSLSMGDIEELAGHRPRFTYDSWKAEVETPKTCAKCGRKVRQRLVFSRDESDGSPMCGTCARERRRAQQLVWEQQSGIRSPRMSWRR